MILDRLAQLTSPSRPEYGAAASSSMVGLPAAGVPVDEHTALRFGAVWGCVKVITETIMLAPWGVFRHEGSTRTPAPEHPVDALLRTSPSPEMLAYAFVSTMTGHALLQGNGYAEIERTGGGVPIALWLLDPNRCELKRDRAGRLFYEVQNDMARPSQIPPEDMFHIRGPSRDGLTGHSVISLARESISAAQATERYGANFFGQGAVPGGLVTHEAESKIKAFDTEGLRNFYKSWKARLGGPNKSNRVMYLEPGMSYTQVSINPDDAQFIETRKLSPAEICRWFRVPPHKIMDLEKATFTNIESQDRQFIGDAVLPWTIRFEQECNAKLLTPPNYSKMMLQALMRGDSAARAAYYQILLDRGVLSINEVRAFEEQNGIGPDGDKRMVPLNMTTLEQLGNDETRGPGGAGASAIHYPLEDLR